MVFQGWLHQAHEPGFNASHLSYASQTHSQRQTAVKLHGVFLSCRGTTASSRSIQFRRVLRRDSAQIVTPFVRVGTYPTRNFATLGPFVLLLTRHWIVPGVPPGPLWGGRAHFCHALRVAAQSGLYHPRSRVVWRTVSEDSGPPCCGRPGLSC